MAYKYKTREKNCVRFAFPDGREINLLGKDAAVTFEATAAQPRRVMTIKGATDADFERILSSDKYKSMHKNIYGGPDPKVVKIAPKPKKSKEKVEKDVSNKNTSKEKSDSK